MGVLLLLRHGQASLGTADYDRLSDLGRRQARLAGARLGAADLRIDRIVCGGLRRQRDTALEVLTELGIRADLLQADPRLDEYDHAGVLAAHTGAVSFETATDDRSTRTVQAALDEALQRWTAGAGGGRESHDGFVRRGFGVMDELTALPGVTLAVTSGGVIALAAARLLGLPPDGWPALARVTVNSGITKIVSGRSGTNLVSFNDHAHLDTDRTLISYR
ncbi:MAG: histidine phosphatase family protein [Jatrophihabitantaceae bacterium]